MPTFDDSYPEIERALLARYGRPAATVDASLDSFEAAVAVMLERTLDAKKVPKGISALSDAGLLEPQALAEADPIELVDLLKSAGVSATVRVVAPIRRLAAWLAGRQERGVLDPLRDESISTAELREELCALSGIGQATADAVLLWAGRRAVYPVDRATYRILVRHGWLDSSAEYDEARSLMERADRAQPDALSQLSAWFEQLGRDHCKASVAKCARCPLQPFLPEGGALEPDAY